MEIVAGLAAFNIPFADTSRSTATCKAGIAGDVMSRTMRLSNMVAFPFTLFFVSALHVAGVPAFVSVIIGGLWVIGSYYFFEDQIKPKRRP